MKFPLIRIFLPVVLFLFPLIGNAQLQQTKRVEFPVNSTDGYFNTFSLGANGLMLARDYEQRNSDRAKVWEVVRMDTSLEKCWTRIYNLEDDFILKGYTASLKYGYLLMEQDNNKKDYYQLLKIDLTTGELQQHKIFKSFNLEIAHFETIDDKLLIGGRVEKNPLVLLYDPAIKQNKVLQGLYDNKIELHSIQLDTAKSVFNIILSKEDARGHRLIVKTYISNGKLLNSVDLETQKGIEFVNGESTLFHGTKQYIVGGYSVTGSERSHGIFTQPLMAGNQEENPSLHYFARMENFFSYSSPKRAKRLKERERERLEKGRKPNIGYNLYLQKLIERDDKFYLLAEVYKKDNNNNNNNNSYYDPMNSVYGQPSYNEVRYLQKRPLKNVKFSHAFVLCFNNQGELMWDNSIKIKEVLGEELQGYVRFLGQENKGALVYYNDEKIHSRSFEETLELEEQQSVDIMLTHANEKSLEVLGPTPELIQWHDNSLILTGIQKVKDERKGGHKRKVFFINKVVYNFNELSAADIKE